MPRSLSCTRCLIVPAAVIFAAPAFAVDAPKTIPLVVDTDIGASVDDAFALGLVVASPEFDLRAVATSGGAADDRAWLVCRFLTQCGRSGIPVAAGAAPQPESKIDWQIQYRRHPAAIFNRTLKPVGKPAHDVLNEAVQNAPGKVTVLALGPLTNVARLLKEHPQSAERIERIVLMGGALQVGYNGKPPVEAEWNVKSDIAAARAVLASGLPLTVVPLDAAVPLAFDDTRKKQLFAIHTRIAFQVQNLYELWETEETQTPPTLFDAAAVAAALGESFFQWSDVALSVDDAGVTRATKGKPTARVATAVDAGKLLDWVVDRLRRSGEPVLPRTPQNASQLIERGGFPVRVHTFEDYDTDIEKRWWMCGKVETRDVPPGGRRACRAVLTQDFDDRQGEMHVMSRAVIFNPVPGPPMGPRTRLAFKYKLRGTDALRVQLYSLVNGYHRYLSLSGLPQGEWRDATVDMTHMRRPDGSGGPLAADERIDDIQFYIDPRAELLIDDVILYEAAADGETRPFPKRILFTGWFDTGKQGNEWPGDFQIVPHEKPRTWKFAQSVANEAQQRNWLRVSFRGARPLGQAPWATFQYRLTGGDRIQVQLALQGKPLTAELDVDGVKRDARTMATLPLTVDTPEGNPAEAADELRFFVARDATLQLDDLLVYEP